MSPHAEIADRIEATIEDEAGLRRLDRELVADARLDDGEREHLRDRIAFYLGDMHARLRAAPQIL